MRLIALALSFLLAAPSPAAMRTVVEGGAIPRVKVLPPSFPVLTPTILPPALSAFTPQTVVPLPIRLAEISARVSQDAAHFESASSEQAAGFPAEHLRLLQGEQLPGRSSSDVTPPVVSQGPPSLPPSAPQKKAIKHMVAGTMAFKLGMEGMTTAIPFVALASLGAATSVALLVVAVYGTAQAVASSFAGALTDRFRASRVLSAAVAVQGSLVAVILGLAAAQKSHLFGVSHWLPSWALFALYAAIGGGVGVAETARRLIPPLILGQNEQALRQYNARLHRFYETAGVAGSALAGLLIWKATALSALVVVPFAALTAAAFFWKVKHAAAPPVAQVGNPTGIKGWLRSYLADLKLAGRIVFRDPRLSALALVMVLPQIVHRLIENLLLPVYAKNILGQEALSAAMLTASNFGELLGATALLRWSAHFTGPYRWVRWGAYGLQALWSLSATSAVPVLLPLILVSSLTWASSHLSLESDLQQKVDARDQPRVISLLFGMYVVGAALAALLIGRLLDAMPISMAFIAVNGAFSAIAMAIWFKSRRLR